MRFSNEIVKKSVKIMAQNEKPILTDGFLSNRRWPAVLRKNREHGMTFSDIVLFIWSCEVNKKLVFLDTSEKNTKNHS